MRTLIDKEVFRLTAMGFITMLEHLRVVILQDAADMIIDGRTHYLFLHLVFSYQLFKDFFKIMRVPLATVVEEEKSADAFGEALDNTINNFHHALDAGLKKMASNINSTEKSSKFQHKTVMQGLIALVTKCDIQKAMNAIMPTKRRNTGSGQTMGILPITLCPPELINDGSDTANTTSDYDKYTDGDETVGEEPVVQCLCLKYTLGDNGLPIGWLNYKPSFMEQIWGECLRLVESLARRRC
jgi:hypothetical protein